MSIEDNIMNFFDVEYQDNSDVESICLKCCKCGRKEFIPDFIYNECSEKVYHEELKQQIYFK